MLEIVLYQNMELSKKTIGGTYTLAHIYNNNNEYVINPQSGAYIGLVLYQREKYNERYTCTHI